jgi:hypothetical protein
MTGYDINLAIEWWEEVRPHRGKETDMDALMVAAQNMYNILKTVRVEKTSEHHWCIVKDCSHGTLNGALALGAHYLAEYQKGYDAGFKDGETPGVDYIPGKIKTP